MDAVFKPALRTYSRAGRNLCRRQQDRDDAVFTEHAFKKGEKLTPEELQINTNLEDQKENEPEKPSTGKKQTRKGLVTTKKTRSKRVPQTKHGRLKTGRQIKRKASAIGQTRKLNLMKNSGSIPKAAVRSHDKVSEWLEKSAMFCKRPSSTSSCKKGTRGNNTSDYPSKEIMRGDRSSEYQSKEIMRGDRSSEYQSKEIMRGDHSREYPSKEIMRGGHSSEYPSIEIMREDHSSEYPSKEIMRGEEMSDHRSKRLFLACEFENVYGSSKRKPQKRQPEDDKLTELKRQEFFAQLKKKPQLQTRRRDDTPVVFDLIHSHSQLPSSVTVESSQYTTDIPTGTETEDLTSRYTELTAEVASTQISKQFLEPEPIQTSSNLDIRKRKNKYMSSTAKFDASDTPKFPTDISSICSSALKQNAEKTPQKSTDFKVPRSPSKQHVKGHRKGNLEPKNSTKLFTTGFVEVVDVFPHMSSIRPHSAEPAQSLVTSNTEALSVALDLEMEWDKRKEPAQIKTSTPNKISSKDGPNFFEFDISSVDAESDEDLLQVNKSSREVNSEEIINLSDIMVGPEENLRSPIHLERRSVIPEDVNKSTEHSKTLQAKMTETIASEKTNNTRPSANAAEPLACPRFQDVFMAPDKVVVKKKGQRKNYGKKDSAGPLIRTKAKSKRGTMSIPRLSTDVHMRDSVQRTFRINRSWHKGDTTFESCPLTQHFTCAFNNMWMLQCIEKNSLKYQDFIKTIPADDLCL